MSLTRSEVEKDGSERRKTTLVPRVTTQRRRQRTRTHDDDDAANVAFRRRNPRRWGEHELARSLPGSLFYLEDTVQTLRRSTTLALHNCTGLLKRHSCGPQVIVVRTSDGRPCTDIVQRDTV